MEDLEKERFIQYLKDELTGVLTAHALYIRNASKSLQQAEDKRKDAICIHKAAKALGYNLDISSLDKT